MTNKHVNTKKSNVWLRYFFHTNSNINDGWLTYVRDLRKIRQTAVITLSLYAFQ